MIIKAKILQKHFGKKQKETTASISINSGRKFEWNVLLQTVESFKENVNLACFCSTNDYSQSSLNDGKIVKQGLDLHTLSGFSFICDKDSS